jgi:dienelactone hydrolase
VRDWSYRDGSLELRGELYEPLAAPKGKAVLVVHEADGIGSNVRRRCEMLAALGYNAGAADMHGNGRVLAGEEMTTALASFRADAGLIRGRVNAAFEALKAETNLPSSSVAAIGYCFGGYAVLELARSGTAAACVASFHGILTTPRRASIGDLRAPILVATGLLDPLVPEEDVTAFESEMKSAGANWHLLKHGRAYHSFSNPTVDRLNDARMRYDPVADAIAWAALVSFLEANAPSGANH